MTYTKAALAVSRCGKTFVIDKDWHVYRQLADELTHQDSPYYRVIELNFAMLQHKKIPLYEYIEDIHRAIETDFILKTLRHPTSEQKIAALNRAIEKVDGVYLRFERRKLMAKMKEKESVEH